MNRYVVISDCREEQQMFIDVVPAADAEAAMVRMEETIRPNATVLNESMCLTTTEFLAFAKSLDETTVEQAEREIQDILELRSLRVELNRVVE